MCVTARPTCTRGGFRDYDHATRKKASDASAAKASSSSKKKAPTPVEVGKEGKEKAVQKYEAEKLAAREAERKKKRIATLEADIAAGDKELDRLRGTLKGGAGDDWEKLSDMARQEQALTKKVDAMLLEWARLSEEVR